MTARRNALVILGAGAILFGEIGSTFAFSGYRINFTPSYNLGLWHVVVLDREIRAGIEYSSARRTEQPWSLR